MMDVDVQAAAWTDIARRFAVNETANGPGSKIENTAAVRAWLPRIITTYTITSMLDAPCGDWNWMRYTDLGDVHYIGYDVEPTILDIARARTAGRPNTEFRNINLLTARRLPKVDLIWCRDLAIHLPLDEAARLVAKFAKAAKYVAITNHPGADNYRDLPPDGHDNRPGYWSRGLDLEAAPFNLTRRVDSVAEAQDGTTGKIGQEMVLFETGQG